MEAFMEIIKYVMANGAEALTAVIALFSAVVAIALMIPGEQPEKFLKSAIDFLSKFSKKK